LDGDAGRAVAQLLQKVPNLDTIGIGSSSIDYFLLTGKKYENITSLDVSGNRVMIRDSKHLDLVRFFQICPNIKKLDLSGTMLTPEIVGTFIEAVPKVECLDLSDNNLGESGLTATCDALKNHANLKDLIFDRNFDKLSKSRAKAIQSLSLLLNSENTKIEKFSIQGSQKSQLKADLLPLIFSLMTNKTLKSINLNANMAGNALGLALAKALQTNRTLEAIYWDENGVNLIGFNMFLIGLQKNPTLKEMPIPLNDVSDAMKEKPTEMAKVVGQIQQCLVNNSMQSAVDKREQVNKTVEKNTGKSVPIDIIHASTLFTQLSVALRENSDLTPKEVESMGLVK